MQSTQRDCVIPRTGIDLQAISERTVVGTVQDVAAGHAAEPHILVRSIGLGNIIAT